MAQDRNSASSDPFGDQGGDAIAQHTGGDPVEVFGIANDEVTDDSQLRRVRLILESSRAFSEAVSALKRKGVNVVVSLEDLPADTGGGRTYGKAGDHERRIALDAADMKPGIHAIDVYAHEFGHVWEDHGGPRADYFMNLVQEDLGIRTTRPTHTVLRSARNPFAPTGSRENPVFDRGTSPYEKGVSRDPFALPGRMGNRAVQFGFDGPVPIRYRSSLEGAIDLVYALAERPKFVELFRKTVLELAGTDLPQTAYLDTLDKMVIHLAETSKNSAMREKLTEEDAALRRDPQHKSIRAFSITDGRDVYLREFLLKQGRAAIAGALVHEAAHLAGVATTEWTEVMLWPLDLEAGYRKQK